MKALHELTKLFMERIIDSEDTNDKKQELCQKWLIFTAAAIYSAIFGPADGLIERIYPINENHAKEVCGRKLTDQKIGELGKEYFWT